MIAWGGWLIRLSTCALILVTVDLAYGDIVSNYDDVVMSQWFEYSPASWPILARSA